MSLLAHRHSRRILQCSGGRCVQRAISVARLALGYETPLPIGYRVPRIATVKSCVYVVAKSFQERVVRLWSPKDLRQRYPRNIRLMGEGFPGGVDRVLALTIYECDGDAEYHMVVGEPGNISTCSVVFGVEL